MRPRLVAFWSPAPQSGKSTAAGVAEGLIGFNSTRLSFAAPVREIAYDLAVRFGEDPVAAEDAIYRGVNKEAPLPVLGKSAVEWLMFVGTALGREFVGADVWVRAMERRLDDAWRHYETPIIDDTRFRNDLDVVRRRRGVLVGIVRPGATVSAARAAAEGHITEADCDAIVENTGSLEAFEQDVRMTLKRLGVESC